MLPAAVASGLHLFGIRYFATSFFSEISRLRCARPWELHLTSSGPSSSTIPPRAHGSSAAVFAHSSAFSLPAIPSCAGHHRISITMPGLALGSAAMSFRAWRAFCCPGPGSSDAIRLMTACASEKIVARSETVFLRNATSYARAIAAHSAS